MGSRPARLRRRLRGRGAGERAVKGEVGETFTAGTLGERTIEEGKTVVVGDPVRFNADNIDNYDF